MATEQRKSPTNILTVIILIAAAFVIGSLWQKNKSLEEKVKGTTNTQTTPAQAQPTKTSVSLEQIKSLFNKNNIAFGDDKRKVLFVEISDPSCPYCGIASGQNAELNNQAGAQFKLKADGGSYVAPVPEMKKLVDGGKASFAYLYYPGHGNGELGAQALYCAFEKGKFWEVHDKLMNNEGYQLLNNTVKNDKTKIPELVQFLSAEIDSSFLKSCLESGKYADKLKKDIETSKSLGLQGTPDFYVNSTNFNGAYSFTDMEPVVNKAL